MFGHSPSALSGTMKWSTHMRISSRLAVALTACLGLALTGCADDGAAESGSATIVYSPPVSGALPFLPVEVALAKGYFKDEGLEVEKKETSPAALPAAMSSGQVDMSADVVYNSARYVESGVDVKYVAGLNDNVDFTLLRRPDVDVAAPGEGADGWKKTFASLKGLKIGTAGKGGPVGLSVAALLDQAGVGQGDFTLIDTPGSASVAALEGKQVDVVVSGGGFDAPLVQNGLAKPVLTFGDGIASVFGDQTNAALVMTASYLADNPDAAAKAQKAIATAIDYIKDRANIDDVLAIATASGTVETDALADKIATYAYDASIDVAGVEAAFAWAKSAGIITKDVDVEATIAKGVETR
jgi:NitT/TauT family transport system substrate-binding protein